MPNNDLKRVVRAEMARTGEPYSAAKARLLREWKSDADTGLPAEHRAQLRAARAAASLSRAEVAERLGIAPLAVWLLESRGVVPSDKTVDDVIALYGLDLTVSTTLRRAAAVRARLGTATGAAGDSEQWHDARSLLLSYRTRDARRTSRQALLRFVAVDGTAIWVVEPDRDEQWLADLGHVADAAVAAVGRRCEPVGVRRATAEEAVRAGALVQARYRAAGLASGVVVRLDRMADPSRKAKP